MSPGIFKLKAILDACQPGERLSPELARWLANALHDYLCHRASSLEEALGLRCGRGGIPWRRVLAIGQRDTALRQLSANFFADVTPCRQARLIHQLAMRYAAANWILDRNCDVMPTRYATTPHEFLWRAFKSSAPMPLCPRRLQTILGQGKSRKPTPAIASAAARADDMHQALP